MSPKPSLDSSSTMLTTQMETSESDATTEAPTTFISDTNSSTEFIDTSHTDKNDFESSEGTSALDETSTQTSESESAESTSSGVRNATANGVQNSSSATETTPQFDGVYSTTVNEYLNDIITRAPFIEKQTQENMTKANVNYENENVSQTIGTNLNASDLIPTQISIAFNQSRDEIESKRSTDAVLKLEEENRANPIGNYSESPSIPESNETLANSSNFTKENENSTVQTDFSSTTIFPDHNQTTEFINNIESNFTANFTSVEKSNLTLNQNDSSETKGLVNAAKIACGEKQSPCQAKDGKYYCVEEGHSCDNSEPCGSNFNCGNSSQTQCMPAKFYCDGLWDCEDGRDEKQCTIEKCSDSSKRLRTDAGEPLNHKQTIKLLESILGGEHRWQAFSNIAFGVDKTF
ncbi:hypothetical protein B4U79_16167 [Dinothrombium tinctorium]|uniref:Uncharacterized protein n=1 Tax=Dinothrombium tinctorium TaxID=1965070 RepID=A0A3S3R1C2_9ACAR|nr:hypothetical protein B4U79_16167 [Dinothrombium tinctorium]